MDPEPTVSTKGPHPRLLIIVPCKVTVQKWEILSLNVDGWGFPGGDHKLMTRSDDPQLSIHGSIPGVTWHGWLHEGMLTDTKPKG